MKINSQKIQRLLIATALASGLVSTGVAASAQTNAATAATTTSKATNVSMATVDAKAKRQADLEAQNADERRIAFYRFGTSL